MGRRYLLRDEADGALRRGRTIECLLGSCERDDIRGIRWASIGLSSGAFELRVFEATDRGGPEFLDLYTFGPLDPSLELDEADEIQAFGSLDECLATLEARWPGSTGQLVNEGVLQDEYRDRIVQA